MRKFTIFCLNRGYPTVAFLLLMLAVVDFSCKSNYQNPNPQNASLYGAWQENVVYDYTYENNLLTRIDTLPAMTNKAIMYTVFKHDGTFEAYEVNGANTIIDEFDGPFTYTQSTNTISQTWPAPAMLTTADKYNIGALAGGTFLSSTTPQFLNYTANISTNNISLTGTIQVIGAPSAGDYVVQVRNLVRWQ